MNFCDNNNNILQWASEPVRIPYQHPLTGKMTTYVPDFIVTYRGPNNTTRAELIEIKPTSQSRLLENQSQRDRAQVAINYCNGLQLQPGASATDSHSESLPKQISLDKASPAAVNRV